MQSQNDSKATIEKIIEIINAWRDINEDRDGILLTEKTAANELLTQLEEAALIQDPTKQQNAFTQILSNEVVNNDLPEEIRLALEAEESNPSR